LLNDKLLEFIRILDVIDVVVYRFMDYLSYKFSQFIGWTVNATDNRSIFHDSLSSFIKLELMDFRQKVDLRWN
jgi:hypothetical protein